MRRQVGARALAGACVTCCLSGSGRAKGAHMRAPALWRVIDVPAAFCTEERRDGRTLLYGGDIRIGDLRNRGEPDFLVYRSAPGADGEGGTRPCFLGAFTAHGIPLWSHGGGGTQPARPGAGL